MVARSMMVCATAGIATLAIACGEGGGGGGGGGTSMKASDFCRGLNKILCEKGKACDGGFPGEVADCMDALNAENCVGVTGFKCKSAGTHARSCLSGIQAWTCDEYMDPTVTDLEIPGCAAMACSDDTLQAAAPATAASSCDCSSVTQHCNITYDGMGNPTEHCSCAPSCCC